MLFFSYFFKHILWYGTVNAAAAVAVAAVGYVLDAYYFVFSSSFFVSSFISDYFSGEGVEDRARTFATTDEIWLETFLTREYHKQNKGELE